MKTENRRVFVMLRPLDLSSGLSGYARLELNHGRVQMTVAVQGFPASNGSGYALLLGGGRTAILGKLAIDVRGQGGAQFNLSPNDVDGAPFSSYGVLAVGRDLSSRFEIGLAGTVGQGGWVDFAAAAKEAYAQLHPAQDAAPSDPPESEIADAPAVEVFATAEPEAAEPETVEPPAETPETAEIVESAEDIADLPAVEPETATNGSEAEDPLARLEQISVELTQQESSIPLPDLLERAFWPQSLWAFHDLFQRFAVDSSIEREGELYARVPLENEPWDHFLLGVRLDGSWVTGAAYCLPASSDGTPPVGFENAQAIASADGQVYYCLWESE